MPQARGTQATFTMGDEDSYGAGQATPDGKKLYVVSFSPNTTQAKEEDDTLTGARTKQAPTPANIDGGGAIVQNVNAESMCHLMKHALGVVTTGRPAIISGTANITGVKVEYAETTTDTGDGTLSFTAVGTTLAWQANGDTAGSGVDVSAGGTFTLESGSANKALTVTVTAGSLPGTDKSDTVSVKDAYQHDFTIGDLPAGFWVDKNYGANISGNNIEKLLGGRIGSTAFELPQSGKAKVTFETKFADGSLDSSATDATPDDNGHTSFSGFNISVMQEGGSDIAKLKSLSFNLNNNLDEDGYVINPAAPGVRVDAAEGDAMVEGELTAVFDSVDLQTKAINSTETSLKVAFSRGDGDGTSGNELVQIQSDALQYDRGTPPIEGPGGVLQTLPFKAYGSNALKVRVRNQIAAV